MVTRILATTLSYVASGRSVVVVPDSAECTTQQAADLLRVSRPFLVKLRERGEVPFRKVGKHRRVSLESLLEYKKRIDDERLKAFEKLAADAQELNLGY